MNDLYELYVEYVLFDAMRNNELKRMRDKRHNERFAYLYNDFNE